MKLELLKRSGTKFYSNSKDLMLWGKLKENREYQLVLFLVILNIVMRIPRSYHEGGVDSFFIHWLARSIVTENHVRWVPDFLSYFFLIKYPSGLPIFLALYNILTGIDMEITIYFASLFFGITGLFGSYLMASELSDNKMFRFFVAFSFSLSPIIVAFTLWEVSARGLFTVVVPFFFWALLKYENTCKKKYIFFALLLTSILWLTHRMIVFMALPWAAFFIYRIYNLIKLDRINIWNKTFPFVYILLFISVFIAFFTEIPFLSYIKHRIGSGYYYEGAILSGGEKGIYFANMFIDYLGRFGPLLFLVPLGFFYSLEKRRKPELLLLFILFSFIPLFYSEQYGTLVLMILFSVFSGFGFMLCAKHLRKKMLLPIVTAVLLFSLFFTNTILLYKMGYLLPSIEYQHPSPRLTDSTYDVAIFVKETNIDRGLMSDDYITIYVDPIAYSTSLPYYWKELIRPIEKEMASRYEMGYLMSRGLKNNGYVIRYDLKYVVTNKDLLANLIRKSRFYQDFERKTDKVYSNENYWLWSLDYRDVTD
jgi:hypothetical protein